MSIHTARTEAGRNILWSLFVAVSLMLVLGLALGAGTGFVLVRALDIAGLG
ncbi:MAG: hypothetical protein ABI776_04115 [Nocardioidaceae bacterium]